MLKMYSDKMKINIKRLKKKESKKIKAFQFGENGLKSFFVLRSGFFQHF